MARLVISVPHRLSQEEATNRIKTLLGEVKTQFADKISELKESWDGSTGQFSFLAVGFKVSGKLTVNSSKAELSGDIPFAASFFKGKIESTVRERAEKLLA